MKAVKVEKLAVGIRSFLAVNPKTAFQFYVERFGALLKSCAHQNYVKQGSSLHCHSIKMGISSHRFTQIKLLLMYLSFKRFTEADKIFNEIDGFDLVAWNCMVSAHCQAGDFGTACCLFDKMPERNEFTRTALVTGFMKFGRVEEAVRYFESCPFHNVVIWTAVISGHILNGLNFEALKLFRRMLASGAAPNEMTLTCVLSGCVYLSNFELGKSILGLIVKAGFDRNLSVCNYLITFHIRMGDVDEAQRIFDHMEERDAISWTAILDAYVEMGKLKEARRVFDGMPERNEISWSAMITRYSQSGEPGEALKLFREMFHNGIKPNISCLSSVLGASASLEALRLGLNLHGHVVKIGIDGDVFIGSSLIDMYCKCGKTKDGCKVFDLVSARNIVCWNCMIAGYSYNADFEEAKELLGQMPVKNVVTWNALIAGYVLNEHCEEVFNVFIYMLLSGIVPNQSTFSSILRACASLSSLEKGKNIHGKIVKLGIQYDVFMGTALTDMYAKSGDIESAKKVFNRMPEKNEISWTAMIQGFADNGLAEECLFQFEEMLKTGAIPSELMFLGVLFACSHCGFVDEGLRYFESMKKIYGIEPRGRHYTSVIDLLARVGRLHEAEEFIKKMPFQPETNAWAALLSACNIYGNEEIGERTAKMLWNMEKENSAGYVLLSNIYASVQRWSDVSRIRRLMKEKGLKKSGGSSWIEVRNEVHTFFVGGETHPSSTEIYKILELLLSEMVLME